MELGDVVCEVSARHLAAEKSIMPKVARLNWVARRIVSSAQPTPHLNCIREAADDLTMHLLALLKVPCMT